MRKISFGKFIVSLALPFAAAAIGSFFTFDAISTWYVFLQKPVLSPPNWIFGPVWTILYFMMGISFYMVWTKKTKQNKSRAISLFFAQLTFNALWSILFFGLKQPYLAFIGIIILWILIFLTIVSFSKISKSAAYLLIPYLLWVTFATYLNLSIWLLNG